MAAPVPVALIPLYATFRIIILNLKNVTDIESSLKKLVLLNFNIKMANDFALKKILKYTPVSEELKDLKDMVIAKVEKLEARIAENEEKMGEEAPEDQDSGSSDVSYSSSDDEEPPASKRCNPSGTIKPIAQRTQDVNPSKTTKRLVIKVQNPFAPRPAQPTASAPRNRQKRSLPSATGPLASTGQSLAKKRKERNEEKKTAPVPQPTPPIITCSTGFRIPKKENVAPTPAPEDAAPLAPAVPVIPVPLLSIVLERPVWLSEQILNRY